MRKITTPILERNGGLDSTRAYRRVTSMFKDLDFTSPRVYHLILMSEREIVDAEPFQKVVKALCRRLREAGIRYRWRGALELDDEKGLHFHVFFTVENQARNPCAIINTTRGGFMHRLTERHAMRFHLSQPKDDMHRVGGTAAGRRKNYASLAGEKHADCMEWISYLVKARSKPTGIRNIYFGSRDGKPALPEAA